MTLKIPRWLAITLGLLLGAGILLALVLRLVQPETVVANSTSPDGNWAIVVRQLGYDGGASYRCECYDYVNGIPRYRELISTHLIQGDSLGTGGATIVWNKNGALVSLKAGPKLELRDGYWLNPNSQSKE